MLFTKKQLTTTNHEKLKKVNLINSDGNMYLTIDFLIEINNTITGSNNITSRKVNVKPYGFEKMYMDKGLIEDKLYKIIDQFNER